MRSYLPTISIALLFVLIALSYFIAWPKYLGLKELEREFQQKTAALKQKEEYYSKLTALSVELEKYHQEFDKIDLAIPKEEGILEILNFLEKKAIEDGLNLKRIGSSMPPKESGKLSKISFYLELSGFYPSFKNYLLDIYRNSRFFEVEAISFSSPSSLETTPGSLTQPLYPVFNFKLNLAVYYLPR